MLNLPLNIHSPSYKNGHVQGIAVDYQRGYVYYSFTTLLLKTDMLGRVVGSVIKLAGHLGCITYDAQADRIYGSLELKHDRIGQGIIRNTGWDPSEQDSFYLAVFDCSAICKENMDAELDGVMKTVFLADVLADYEEIDEVSEKKHRYGCSGIDGIGLGPIFGAPADSTKKIMIAYGVYCDVEREDNDYQVILSYDLSVIEKYAIPLEQANPHRSGPNACEQRYFFYTGNTTYGVQNLEYDSASQNWFLAVYCGKKSCFDNFNMFFIDGKKSPQENTLVGRGGQKGLVLCSAELGCAGKNNETRGSYFKYGSTGIASLGDGTFYFSQDGNSEYGFFTDIVRYEYAPEGEDIFKKLEVT